jgi:hypothetical protein
MVQDKDPTPAPQGAAKTAVSADSVSRANPLLLPPRAPVNKPAAATAADSFLLTRVHHHHLTMPWIVRAGTTHQTSRGHATRAN